MVVVVVLVVVVVTFGAIFTPWSQKKTPPVIQVTQKTNHLIFPNSRWALLYGNPCNGYINPYLFKVDDHSYHRNPNQPGPCALARGHQGPGAPSLPGFGKGSLLGCFVGMDM